MDRVILAQRERRARTLNPRIRHGRSGSKGNTEDERTGLLFLRRWLVPMLGLESIEGTNLVLANMTGATLPALTVAGILFAASGTGKLAWRW